MRNLKRRKLTDKIDGHEVEGDAGGGLEGGVHDGDLGVALAEVGQHGAVGLGLEAHLHRLARQAVLLVYRLRLQGVLERCLSVTRRLQEVARSRFLWSPLLFSLESFLLISGVPEGCLAVTE